MAISAVSVITSPPDRCIRLLMANVLQENRRSDLVLAAIADADPDVVLLVETDEWWARALRHARTVTTVCAWSE